jgi:ATP-dependent Clp protease ATP-binding subunit ClpA
MVEKVSGMGTYRGGKIDLAPGTQEVLEFAIDEARRMGHHYIGTEHLLLGLVRLQEGPAVDVLRKLGVTPEQIRRQPAGYCRRRHRARGCSGVIRPEQIGLTERTGQPRQDPAGRSNWRLT